MKNAVVSRIDPVDAVKVNLVVWSGLRIKNSEDEDDDDEDFSNEMSQEMFDWITSDRYSQTQVASGVMQRYAKNNPAKAVSQLCTAISKWTQDYLR